MNSIDSESDVEAAASINGRNEQSVHTWSSSNRPCDGSEINDSSQDSDYRSERSSETDDHMVTSNDITRNENYVSGSTQSVWQNRILTSGLLRSNAAWPLAEGSLRHRYDVDISQENSNSFENRFSNRAENSNGTEKCEETDDKGKFKFSSLTRDQKVILIATSITNLLSFLSLSILAPFFPLEVSITFSKYTCMSLLSLLCISVSLSLCLSFPLMFCNLTNVCLQHFTMQSVPRTLPYFLLV